MSKIICGNCNNELDVQLNQARVSGTLTDVGLVRWRDYWYWSLESEPNLTGNEFSCDFSLFIRIFGGRRTRKLMFIDNKLNFIIPSRSLSGHKQL